MKRLLRRLSPCLLTYGRNLLRLVLEGLHADFELGQRVPFLVQLQNQVIRHLAVGHKARSLRNVTCAAVSDEAMPLLEVAYGLYTEHFVLGGPDHGASHWAAALKAVQPVCTAPLSTSDLQLIDKYRPSKTQEGLPLTIKHFHLNWAAFHEAALYKRQWEMHGRANEHV